MRWPMRPHIATYLATPPSTQAGCRLPSPTQPAARRKARSRARCHISMDLCVGTSSASPHSASLHKCTHRMPVRHVVKCLYPHPHPHVAQCLCVPSHVELALPRPCAHAPVLRSPPWSRPPRHPAAVRCCLCECPCKSARPMRSPSREHSSSSPSPDAPSAPVPRPPT
jgi:hypothetical protein